MGRLEIRPQTCAIGAEISGVDLREALSAEIVAAIECALQDHLVLFFRDQPITPAQQIAFTRRFGRPLVHPFGPTDAAHPELIVLDQVRPVGEGADLWHSDTSYLPEPPMGAILHAVELPGLGGDTCFASMVAAYEALSPELRGMLDGLRAVHDIGVPVGRAVRHGRSRLSLEEARAKWPPVSHPVVRTHPVSGRRALYVSDNATTHIEGLTERENARLLPFLLDHVRSPEFQCRFRWEPHSVAFWDNRASQHCGVPDYDERRVMHRTSLAGDVPC